MAQSKKDITLEERKIIAFEKMAKAFDKIGDALEERNDYLEDMNLADWSERLEWYLNEFFQIYKSKKVGSTNRPPRDAERITETKDTE
jgi:uncharacterized protein YozE (UPF0346 family)